MRISILASAKDSIIGDRGYGFSYLGSQNCYHMPTVFPFPILHLHPLTSISLPCKMLVQAYKPPLEFSTSIIMQLGKKQALKTLWNKESGFFKSHHACLANNESLYKAKSLKPRPPTNFDFVNSSHFNQWIRLLSPLWPHHNFFYHSFNIMA